MLEENAGVDQALEEMISRYTLAWRVHKSVHFNYYLLYIFFSGLTTWPLLPSTQDQDQVSYYIHVFFLFFLLHITKLVLVRTIFLGFMVMS